MTQADCCHQPTVAAGRKRRDLPEFHGSNTVLANPKTSQSGSYHAFAFAKYAVRYLAAFAYRFNRRFHLEALPVRLLVPQCTVGPHPNSP